MGKKELNRLDLVIETYDDSKRTIKGTFKTVVKIGPIEVVVEFIVLDIPIIYGLLLG